MDRREMLGVLGVGATGLAALGATSALASQGKLIDAERRLRGGHFEMAQLTAKACTDCLNECNGAFHHCFTQVGTGNKEYADALRLCVDCAELCGSTAALCGRVSPLLGFACEACAKCCEACIVECEKLKDSEMANCIESCRKCAKACRDMAKAHGL
ncbi:MAG: four-helix bundle copper-binding protein [Planctomycetes bacterium]|nr:four-helix bundle copper-binding protein [Planctomycetota bacterium]